jgi:aminoglycoside phosphotransferase (APT) family kinase protein
VAHHRGAERHRRAAHRGDSALHRPRRPGLHLLSDGLRGGLVAHGDRSDLAASIRRRHRRPPGLAYQLVDGIAKLSKVDWRAKDLQDLGRPEGFHERQVERWTRFLERVQIRDIPGLDVASSWLRTHRPLDYVPGIMHGDYQFANVMFSHGAPARLAAIVDWEMGTVGDPKLDLAWVVQGWPEDTSRAAGASYVDLTGMPSRTQLLEYYATESGRQVDDIDYYVILARWKLAIVLEQGYARAMQGEASNPKVEAFGPIVLDLMARAADLAETTDYR